VLIDNVNADAIIGRSYADAPEIDGNVFIDPGTGLNPGDLVKVTIERSDEYDLYGTITGQDPLKNQGTAN
jgi:ribosomal protein S12 methylthiotransferase